MATNTPVINPGLEGVIAAQTRLSRVDGQRGELLIAGYALEDIALNATFEEMIFLLWNDRLPTASELTAFGAELRSHRALPTATIDLLRAAAARKVAPIDALRMGADTLSLQSDGTHAGDARLAVASFPTIVAAYWRLLNGYEPISPRDDLGHAANLLYMLTGEEPTGAQSRALATYLNTVCDHGLNASTFTARVIISTNSDMLSAVVGALGALKGPAHGGAPGPALDTVFEIGRPEDAERVLWAKLRSGERLMGFGHRVYKVRDPRADVLKTEAGRLFAAADQHKRDLFDLAQHVESVALRVLEEHKPGRNLQTNVEYFTALVLHGLDLPTDLFTPTFAIGRVGGWTAHAFEQLDGNRIIRPRAEYIGETDRRWQPVDSR